MKQSRNKTQPCATLGHRYGKNQGGAVPPRKGSGENRVAVQTLMNNCELEGAPEVK